MPNFDHDILRKTREALDKVIEEKKQSRSFLASIGPAIVEAVSPLLERIAALLEFQTEDITKGVENAMSKLKVEINPEVKIPEIKIPEIKIPLIKVPKPEITVNVPPIKIPKIEIPKFDFPNDLEVSLKREFDYKNPMPVILMDDKGNPYLAVSGGSSGPKVVQDILTAGGQSAMDEANKALRVNIISGGGGTQYNDSATPDQSGGVLTLAGAYDGTGSVFSLRNGSGVSDKALRVVQATDVASSVSATQVGTWNIGTVTSITNSVSASIVDSTGVAFEGANPFPITGTVTGITNSVAVSVVDSTGVAFEGANAFPITGTVTGITNSVAVSVVDSTGVAFEGANGFPITGTLTAVTNITNSVASSLIDSTGVQYSGSNPLPIVGPVVVTSITNTTATNIVDSTGVAYSGSNPLPIVGPVVVTSITNTTAVVGNINSYGADDETPPVKVGGIARTTNPTKASDGNRISQTYDAIGRALVRPVQVRGLVQTAYVSISTGTETTLLAGIASTFLDLVYVMATNSSDAAVTVDLRAATGAGIVTSIRVPANGTAGVSLSVPIPQDAAADTWTADLPDITGTTVTLGALFSREV